jgi:Tfp pilus assembly protein PilN
MIPTVLAGLLLVSVPSTKLQLVTEHAQVSTKIDLMIADLNQMRATLLVEIARADQKIAEWEKLIQQRKHPKQKKD